MAESKEESEDSKGPNFLLDRNDSANVTLPNVDNQAENKHNDTR